MRVTRTGTARFGLLLALIAAACFEGPTPTGPGAADSSPDLVEGAGLLRSAAVQVLRRTDPLEEDQVATAVIGPEGGVIRLAEAGLTVYFPPLCVTEPTTITVVAPAGDLVGYRFSPHGLRFLAHVTAVQELDGAAAAPGRAGGGGDLRAAYFEGDLRPAVRALEILPVDVVGNRDRASFDIDHFSGYVIATN